MKLFRKSAILLLLVGSAFWGIGCDSVADSCSGVLQTTDIVIGNGLEANTTSRVTVDYVGRLANGTVFDDGMGVSFGLNQVIQGFRDGIAGMREGGRREIVIPPDQAYGENGIPGSIPSCATLTFDVTLISVDD